MSWKSRTSGRPPRKDYKDGYTDAHEGDGLSHAKRYRDDNVNERILSTSRRDPNDSDDDFTVTVIGSEFEKSAQDRRKEAHTWNQIVTDDEGRRRFHGAFTGGFSAGYYNTVGSKEGFTPSTFTSSRSKRSQITETRPQDFMDDDDLEISATAGTTLTTRDNIQSFGAKQTDEPKRPHDKLLRDVFVEPKKEMIGEKLLATMGWRHGQGIGPRRKRRKKIVKKIRGPVMPGTKLAEKEIELEDEFDPHSVNFTFAPSNVGVYKAQQKKYRYGIGYDPHNDAPDVKEEREKFSGKFGSNQVSMGPMNVDPNDDVYAEAHVSEYDISIPTSLKNSSTKPHRRKESVLTQKAESKTERKRCSDGYYPIPGFVMATVTSITIKRWQPPRIPKDFDEIHRFSLPGMQLTDDVTKLWTPIKKRLTHEQRGKILGERQLPGAPKPPPEVVQAPKISEKDRSKISDDLKSAFTSGTNLAPHKYGGGLIQLPKTQDKLHDLKHAFEDDLNKQARFDRFYSQKLGIEPPPYSSLRVDNLTDFQKREETAEFERCFEKFKNENRHLDVIRKMPSDKNKDLEKAMEKIEHITVEWRPSRLLCKRFNVPDPYEGVAKAPKQMSEFDKRKEIVYGAQKSSSSSSVEAILREGLPDLKDEKQKSADQKNNLTSVKEESDDEESDEEVSGKPPPDLFKAIFEEDSSDESSDDSSDEEDEQEDDNLIHDNKTTAKAADDISKPNEDHQTINKHQNQMEGASSSSNYAKSDAHKEYDSVKTAHFDTKEYVHKEYSSRNDSGSNAYKPTEQDEGSRPKIKYNQSLKKLDFSMCVDSDGSDDFDGPGITIHGIKQNSSLSKTTDKEEKTEKKKKHKRKKDKKIEKERKTERKTKRKIAWKESKKAEEKQVFLE